MTRYVLGVDLGTSGPKVALVTTTGEVVDHDTEKVGLTLLPKGGAEQDPDDWWAAIVASTRRLVDRNPAAAEQVTAICMSSQWGGLVPVDAAGKHVHNALIWMDARGVEYAEKLTGGGVTVPSTGYNARALREWIKLSGGVPSRSGKDPVGQAQFLRHDLPEVYAKTAYLLDVPEYLTMKVCGRAVAAYDTSTLRWATDNRDPGAVRWDPGLVKRSGLDLAKLPELVPPGSVVGTLLPEVAAELGLSTDVQVVAGTGDTTSAAVGAGAVEDYAGHLYIGTSAWLTAHVPYKRTDVLHGVASLPAVVPNRYWIATVQEVAGKAIEWLIDNVVYAQDGMLEDRPRPDDALERLNALAASAPAGANGVLFTPWLNGERTPIDDPFVRGGWHHVSLSTTRADLARAVFEGIALNARWMKETVERFTRKERPNGFSELTFVGGGARSALWCQTLADVLGCDIKQAKDPVLANARGAALIASVGAGEISWSDVSSRVEIDAVYRPNPAQTALHDRQFRKFTALYRRTKKLSKGE
ncbi:MAG TPA: FGGY-family carbohydrate kinase [Aeromicrobium sp.]|nr:FGGY-family carbohydrate kinase [Aeromicrobium sp.]